MTGFLGFIGHGRALECYLVGVKILFGLFIVPATAAFPGLADLPWFIPEPIIAAPFFFIGILQGIGLWLNARGVESSWILRAAGALLAIMLWTALITKALLVATIINPFYIMSWLGSVFILWKALNRLPVPGVRGALG